MSNPVNKCPICEFDLKETIAPDSEKPLIKCPVCGEFSISDSVIQSPHYLKTIKKSRRRLSGIIRYLNRKNNKHPTLTIENLDEYINNPIVPGLQDIERKLEFLFSAIKTREVIPASSCNINLITDYPLAFAHDSQELERLLVNLEEDGLIEFIDDSPFDTTSTFKERKKDRFFHTKSWFTFTVTRKGWGVSAINDAEIPQGFIAVDFDNSMDKTIVAMEESISKCGFVPMSIKYKNYPETVMEKALGEIRKSKFVIVNITNLKPSVFYEAGFAKGIGKPIFYVCNAKYRNDKKKLEFYSKHYDIKFYKDLPALKKIIVNMVEANFSIRLVNN